MSAGSPAPWWRRAVAYQIYPRSFADSNGDGMGDVAGIRSRLPYLRDLGVDAIWISPWYPSPLNDGGYDVSDYRDIDRRLGSLEDAEELIADAHDQGIRVVVDIVPNHTSSEHPWFQEALASPPGSPARDRYIFRSGKGDDGSLPPSNWLSAFGGPAWERVVDGEWYLHLFHATQPDLNWANEDVRAEFDSIFRFWLERGIDGFRIDVAHSLTKDLTFPDVATKSALLEPDHVVDHPHWDRDDVHEIIRRWRRILDAVDGRDVMMVAEAWVHPERLPLYLRPDEYHLSFNFDLLEKPWGYAGYRDAIERSHESTRRIGATSTWVLSNHDVIRHATRLGLRPGVRPETWSVAGPLDALDPAAGIRRARAATLLILALPGTTYLYQGEELGLPEVWDLPQEVLDDPVWEYSGRKQTGRDGCRVPIPWTRDGASFGFGKDGSWLPQPGWFSELSVEAQTGVPGSTLEMYRSALALRRTHLIADDELEWLAAEHDVLAFRRGSGVVCFVNFGTAPVALPEGELLIASEPIDGALPCDTTAWIRTIGS